MKLQMAIVVASLLALTMQSANAQIPETINFSTPGAFENPESLGYDAQTERFFVSSGNGRIATVTHDGVYETFADAPTEVTDAGLLGNGIFVDRPRNRVLQVWSAFQGNTDQAYLGIYDLDDGSQTALIDVPAESPFPEDTGRHFLNVVEVDDAGNAYITDSFSPVVYRVDADNNVSPFIVEPEIFGTDEGVVGAAALDILDDRLFIGVPGSSSLFIKDLTDETSELEQVDITGTIMPAIDGIEFVDDSRLALMLGQSDKIGFLETTDDWETATVSDFSFNAPATSFPTEGTTIDGDLHVVYSFFGAPGGTDFTIQRVATVPEPATLALVACSGLLIPLLKRRRRSN